MPPFRMVRPRRAWTPPKPKPPVYRGPKLLPGPPRGKRGRAATAAAAPSFNPLTAITWEAVFFAEDADWTNPGDGNAVSQWDDASANSRHASQATSGKRPIYRSSVAALNNKPALDFTRASQQSLSTASWTLAQPMSYVAVANLDATAGENYLVHGGSAASAFLGDTNTSNKWQMYAGTTVRESSGAPDTAGHLFTWVYNGASSVAYLDGTSIIALGSPGTGGVIAGLNIGRFATAETANWDGAVAFVGVYAGDITADGQYANLKTFFAAHYNLTVV